MVFRILFTYKRINLYFWVYMHFKVKNGNLWVAVFRISGVWHVGWWNLITGVRLIQVGNNRNDYFRYFLGVLVHLIEVSA